MDMALEDTKKGDSLQAPSKRLKMEPDKSGELPQGLSMKKSFQELANKLDSINAKRDAINKMSRDVTVNSKNVISLLHRMDADTREEVMSQAEAALEAVRKQYLARVAQQLAGDEFWKFNRSYSPGVQEYVEAVSFFEFLKLGRLVMPEDIDADFARDGVVDAEGKPFRVLATDYLLGVADLTGELMRTAVSSVGSGHHDVAVAVGDFVRRLHGEFLRLGKGANAEMKDLAKKMDVMLQSLSKIENVNYARHIRAMEFPNETVLKVELDM